MTTEFQIKVGDGIASVAHPWIEDISYNYQGLNLTIKFSAWVPINFITSKLVPYAEQKGFAPAQAVLDYNLPAFTTTTKYQILCDEALQVGHSSQIYSPENLTPEEIAYFIYQQGVKAFGGVYDLVAEKTKVTGTKIIHTKPASGGIISGNGDWLVGGFAATSTASSSGYSVMASRIKEMLPGVNHKIECPAPSAYCIKGYDGGPYQDSIWGIVMHLNDLHQMPREKIADWLDELHDNGVVDLEITSPDQDKA